MNGPLKDKVNFFEILATHLETNETLLWKWFSKIIDRGDFFHYLAILALFWVWGLRPLIEMNFQFLYEKVIVWWVYKFYLSTKSKCFHFLRGSFYWFLYHLVKLTEVNFFNKKILGFDYFWGSYTKVSSNKWVLMQHFFLNS